MGRAPCCDKANVKKGPWSVEEDSKLKAYIEEHGTGGNWIALPKKVGLKRCGKSCRLRWLNYLRPNIKRGEFSEEEDEIICCLYASMGTRWSIIASQLPGRTDNDIKNHWNARLRKKLLGKLNDLHNPQLAAEAKQNEVNRIKGYCPLQIKIVPYGYATENIAQVDEHANIKMNCPYVDFYPKIVSQLYEQANCSQVYTIADTSPNTQSATFQPVFGNQISQSNNDTSLRMPVTNLLDLSDKMNIITPSQMEPSNLFSNTSQLLNSASQISYQAESAPPLECIPLIEDHGKLDISSVSGAKLPETVNSPLFPLLGYGGFSDGIYESGWMNTLNFQNNMNLNISEFSMERNDLLYTSNSLLS